jgi:hypothetical protein
MKTMDLIEQFEDVLQTWREREAAYISEAMQYETRFHHAIAYSDGRNAEARKADAILQTADIAARKAKLELEAQEAKHRVEFFKRLAGRSE